MSETTLARNLRRSQTDAERLLWSRLRNKQIDGIKFRRQVPIGSYIVDFVSFEKYLVIELDGSQHDLTANKVYDDKRTAYLQTVGHTVLRFWNNEVLANLDGVLEVIHLTLALSSKERGS